MLHIFQALLLAISAEYFILYIYDKFLVLCSDYIIKHSQSHDLIVLYHFEIKSVH